MPFGMSTVCLSSIIIPSDCCRTEIQEVCVTPACLLPPGSVGSHGSQEEFTSCKVKCSLPHYNFLSFFSFSWKGMIEGENELFDI